MSLKITSACINCGACEIECPNKAIYEGGKSWVLSEGTSIKSDYIDYNGERIYKNKKNKPLSKKFYYIVKEKCTECIGFFKYPQCAAVCPVNCCIKDEKNKETLLMLKKKKKILHGK